MADATTIFTSRSEDVGKIHRLLKAFYKISGLKPNVEKTIAYTLGPISLPQNGESTYGLLWRKLPICLLGVTITTDQNESYNEIFKNKIESISNLTKI